MITGTTAREYSIIAGIDRNGKDIRRPIPTGTEAQCRRCENVKGAWILKVPGYGSKVTFEYPLS